MGHGYYDNCRVSAYLGVLALRSIWQWLAMDNRTRQRAADWVNLKSVFGLKGRKKKQLTTVRVLHFFSTKYKTVYILLLLQLVYVNVPMYVHHLLNTLQGSWLSCPHTNWITSCFAMCLINGVHGQIYIYELRNIILSGSRSKLLKQFNTSQL